MQLDEWQEGDRVGAAKLNQPIAAIKAIRQQLGGPQGPQGQSKAGSLPALAYTTVTALGGDYADARYWCQFAKIDGGSPALNSDSITVTSRSRSFTNDSAPSVVTATNLAERSWNSHLLPASTPVLVHPVYDAGSPQTMRWVFTHPPEYRQLVKITGSASGGGKYTGVRWTRPTTGAAATGNLTEAELGTTAVTAIRVLNTREVGLATHDLASASFLPLIFPAEFRGIAADGAEVWAIDGAQQEDCT